jgi:hypothetical protein
MNGKGSQWAKVQKFRKLPRLAFAIASCMVVGSLAASGADQRSAAPIRLLPQLFSQIRTEGLPSNQIAALAKMPASYHHFGVAAVGKPAKPQALTLQFAASTTISEIFTTPDFRVVSGGTCQAGRRYSLASTCQLLVQFTPQGAGPRLGKLTLDTSANHAVSIGLLGYSYFPVVSFTPSVIATVPATIASGKGLIHGAHDLGIDNGDELYIPDTGDNIVEYIDSSGVMRTLASNFSGPWGVTVDLWGEVYFSLPSNNTIYIIFDYGPVVPTTGSGTDACQLGSSCHLNAESVGGLGAMASDGANNIFFIDNRYGAAVSTVLPQPATLLRLYDPFPYQTIPPGPVGADAYDNLYSSWTNGGTCSIIAQSLYNAENDLLNFTKVAGGHTCGFSGDGGQADGAEIGKQIGQIAFDLAGNMYFTDTANNRVRRVDGSTGIIRTIAGNGSTGDGGDGGPATAAAVGAPAGVTIDSNGRVDILASDPAGTAQVVRQVSATGELSFASQKVGTTSTLLLNVANTGNLGLTFNGQSISGTNHGDFTINSAVTNCNFAAGNYLNAGRSCQIGVIYKPAKAGTSVAVLFLPDNTINGVNGVKLNGTATTAAVVKFTSPSPGATVASGTPVTLAVTVSARNGPAPTGTVSFSVDGKHVGTNGIVSGAASVKTGSLAAGTHIVQAVYTGDKYHPQSETRESITVSP